MSTLLKEVGEEMKQIMLTVNQNEYELLSNFGLVSPRPDNAKETFSVTFEFPSEVSVEDLAASLEDSIAQQESDHGDWVRAQAWRQGKSELLSKVRRAYLTLVREV